MAWRLAASPRPPGLAGDGRPSPGLALGCGSRSRRRRAARPHATPGNPPTSSSLGDLLSPTFARSLQLPPDALDAIMALAGTTGPVDLDTRARALAAWKARLRVGALPDPGAAPWPDARLGAALVSALQSLDLPRFCRRHPALLDALIMQVLGVVAEFEKRLAEAEAGMDEQAGPPPPPPPPERRPGEPGEADPDAPAGEGGTRLSDAPPPEDGAAGGAEGQTEPDWEAAASDALKASAGGGPRRPEGQDTLQLGLDSEVQDVPDPKDPDGSALTPTKEDANKAAAAEIAAALADEFEAEWRPVADSLGDAEAAFEDLSELVDGPRGFDTSHALWRDDAGWREVAGLSAKLEQLKELRDLIRSLGRSAGKGPLRRAPAQVDAPRRPPGVLRSPLQPEETAGLARSGDLSRMLPHEAHLVAVGWPRGRGEVGPDGALITGSRPARRLHLARRAERTLLSYDRTGWLEGEPARTTDRLEVRPAAELGPIIVCLDTSASMAGARETVAKAVALEAARAARRSGRACFLYAFSGPGDVVELDVRLGDPDALAGLLAFLRGSFGGGTDADEPLLRSLARLEGEEAWARADILLVTDGEIGPPSPDVLARLDAAKAGVMGLEVHGLLVGRVGAEPSEAVRAICSHIHTFKSWSAVGG